MNHAQQARHKLNGLAQIVVELHYAYRKTAAAIYLGLFATIILTFTSLYRHYHNPRILTGDELTQANRVFDAIRTADSLAEDFTAGSRAREVSREG